MSIVNDKIYRCPLELAVELIGGKWKCVILWHLRKGPLRFSELKRRLPGITQKMLTQQLRDLEHNNLVFRKVYPVVPPKVEYSLTNESKEFASVLKNMYKWGTYYSNEHDIEIDTSLQETIIRQETLIRKNTINGKDDSVKYQVL